MLAFVLVGVTLTVGWSASFSADEGAARIQTRWLAARGDWIVEHPLPAADPTGIAYPLHLAYQGADGGVPFGRHPGYVLLLVAAQRAMGDVGPVAVSVVTAWLAAVLAALLARRVVPGTELLALWGTGVATPLLFQSQVVIAHAPGAAIAAATALAAVTWLGGGPDGRAGVRLRRAAAAFGVIVGATAGVMVRGEGLLLALAVAAALMAVGVRRRAPATALLGVATAAVALPVALLGMQFPARVAGPAIPLPADPGYTPASSFLAGRLHAVATTWFGAGYGHDLLAQGALLLGAALAVSAAALLRRRPGDPAVLLLAAVASTVVVARVALLPHDAVPGLFVAAPALGVALVAVRRPLLSDDRLRFLAITGAVFVALVTATQHPVGGNGEWGWRYVTIAIPLLVVVLLPGLRELARSAGPRRRELAAALAVMTAAMSVLGVAELRGSHRLTRDAFAEVAAVAETSGPPGDGDPRPVLVALGDGLPRFAWSTFEEQRWLRGGTDEGRQAVLDRLAGLGIETVVVMAPSLEDAVAAAPTSWRPEAPVPVGGGWIVVPMRTGPG